MASFLKEEKYLCILNHEERFAHKLARKVITKPVPPIWMILIPVFFVLHAYRIKQYEKGLKAFADNYLKSRKASLEAVLESIEKDVPVDIEKMAAGVEELTAEPRAKYEKLLQALTDHYRALMDTPGENITTLVQRHYQRKSSYQLYLDRLVRTEHEFNMSLLPQIEGEETELRDIIIQIKGYITQLHADDLDELFA